MSHRNQGYAAGYQRGQQDGIAETCARWTRDPSHEGHAGEPPAELTGGARDAWISGFLDGYRHGRDEATRGVSHVAP